MTRSAKSPGMYPLPPSIDFALSRPPAAELRLSQDSDVERLVVADQRTMEVKSRSSDRDTGARFSPLRLSSAHAGFACFGPPGVLQDMSSEELLHTPRRKAKGSGRAPKTPTQKSRGQVKDCRTHTRDESLHVNYTVEDVERLAQEVHEETIADVHLSLFAFWIRDKEENYEMATKYIRELKLDQGYKTRRIPNSQLRQLLDETLEARPMPPHRFKINKAIGLSASPIPTRSSSVHSQQSQESELPELPTRVKKGKLPAALSIRSSNSIPSSPREYPPNTPDRPAPLNLRSFSSTTNSTMRSPDTTPLRSFSSPLRQAVREELPDAPHTVSALPRNTLIFEENFSHPLLTPTRGPSTPSRAPRMGPYTLSPSEVASDDDSDSIYSCHGESLLDVDADRPMSIHSEPLGDSEWTDLDTYVDSEEDGYAGSEYSRWENSSEMDEPTLYLFTQQSGPAPLGALPPSPPRE